MASDTSLTDFFMERFLDDHSKAKKASFNRILMKISEGWRPVTPERPLPFAPPSISALIVACINHDPQQRPSFSYIVEQLSSKCKEEVEASRFLRAKKKAIHEGDSAVSDSVPFPAEMTGGGIKSWEDGDGEGSNPIFVARSPGGTSNPAVTDHSDV